MESELLNSRETELSILGSIMYEPGMFSRATALISEEDFFYPENSRVFQAMSALFAAGLDINIKSVWNYLYKQGFDGLTEQDIADMLLYRVDGASFVTFASQVAEFSGFRLLEGGMKRISASIKRKDSDLASYSAMLGELIRKVSSKDAHTEFSTGDALTSSFVELLRKEKNTLKYTGIPVIDNRLVDFDSKEISYLAARPGTGKTAMMLQSARVNLESGARVGFLSMEMSVAKLMNRLISSRAEVNGEDMLKMHETEFVSNTALREALEWYSSVPLFIDDAGPFTQNSVMQKIRKMVYEHGCDVVYIDYIGLIQPTASNGSRNDQLSAISRELKGLSSELDIPLVIASQLSRDVVKRGNHRPNLADLRDSGALEQDASIVAFLYPDVAALSETNVTDIDSYLKEQSEVFVKFEIAKQRNGPVFSRELIFYKPYGRFVLKDEALATY